MKFLEHLTIKPDRPFWIACALAVIPLTIGYLAYPMLTNSIIELTTEEYRLDRSLPNDKVFIVSGQVSQEPTTEYSHYIINDGYGMWSINILNTSIANGDCIKAVVYKSIGELKVIKVLGAC